MSNEGIISLVDTNERMFSDEQGLASNQTVENEQGNIEKVGGW